MAIDLEGRNDIDWLPHKWIDLANMIAPLTLVIQSFDEVEYEICWRGYWFCL